MNNYQTLKEAGYTFVRRSYAGHYILRDADGKHEVWFHNQNHAGYGLVYRGLHLEFARTFYPPYEVLV